MTRVALAMGLTGLALMAFGMLFVTTYGCIRGNCGPSIQEVAFWTGAGLFAVAVLLVGAGIVRSVRRADAVAGSGPEGRAASTSRQPGGASSRLAASLVRRNWSSGGRAVLFLGAFFVVVAVLYGVSWLIDAMGPARDCLATTGGWEPKWIVCPSVGP